MTRFEAAGLDSMHIPGSSDTISLIDDLAIHPEHIIQEFAEHPAKFAFWAACEADAKNNVNTIQGKIKRHQNTMDTTWARLDTETRVQLSEVGRVTEGKVSAAIRLTPEWQVLVAEMNALQVELSDASKVHARLLMAKEAMIQRRDMLVQLGAQLRSDANNLSV